MISRAKQKRHAISVFRRNFPRKWERGRGRGHRLSPRLHPFFSRTTPSRKVYMACMLIFGTGYIIISKSYGPAKSTFLKTLFFYRHEEHSSGHRKYDQYDRNHNIGHDAHFF